VCVVCFIGISSGRVGVSIATVQWMMDSFCGQTCLFTACSRHLLSAKRYLQSTATQGWATVGLSSLDKCTLPWQAMNWH
jgi:hypothetical protein